MEGTILDQQDDLVCPIFAPDNVFFCPLKIKKTWDLLGPPKHVIFCPLNIKKHGIYLDLQNMCFFAL